MTDINQAAAKKILDQWLADQKISITDFSKALDYHYTWAWSLVRGKAPLRSEFIGRMLAAYGPEAAQLINDALNGAAESQPKEA